MTSETQTKEKEFNSLGEVDAGSTPATPPFKYLVKGDISGIQGFIFNVKSDLAAKSLKGRSFFLKILIELGIQMLFDECGLTNKTAQEDARISTSGGNFVLQLELPSASTIDGIQKRFNKALQYTGLNMVLACVPMGQNYGATLQALNQKIRERKYRLLLGEHSFFEPFERNHTAGINKNEKWVDITNCLKPEKATHFSIKKEKEGNDSEILKIDQQGNRLIMAGYVIEFGNEGIALKDYLESLFPNYGNQTPTFETLAKGVRKESGKNDRNAPKDKFKYGIQKLGVLAMDVDNLGATLEMVNSPEGHCTFDKRLQHFFNSKLREIINQPDFKDRVYVVTAGGDDSFFVGKWNTMIELAIEIKKAFGSTFHEKELSISAALVIVDMNFPVVRFAEMADNALEDAKYKYPNHKGNINIFGEVLDWTILENEVFSLRRRFYDFNKPALFTSGLMTKARLISIKIAKGEGIQLTDFWKLGYYMRNFQGQGSKILNDFNKYLAKATDEKNNPVKRKTYQLIFAVAARLAEFDKR